MPAESERQRKAAGAALSAKRGDRTWGSLGPAARSMFDSMSQTKLREFAAKPIKKGK